MVPDVTKSLRRHYSGLRVETIEEMGLQTFPIYTAPEMEIIKTADCRRKSGKVCLGCGVGCIPALSVMTPL